MDGLDGFDFPLLPLPFDTPMLIPYETVQDFQELYVVPLKGVVLPHYQAMLDILYGTSCTRAHMANVEHVKRMAGRIESVDIYSQKIDMELWRRCSNLTLWVMNALFSLTTLVSRSTTFLYNPARNLKRVAFLGARPEKCMTSAQVTITHDDGTTTQYQGTMPCGLFVALMGMYTIATTAQNQTSIWGRTETRIVEKLQTSARNNCINVRIEHALDHIDDMIPLATLVLLSKRVRSFAVDMSRMVGSPEPLTDTSTVATNCPSCSRKVSTATPRHKLEPTHEEYDPEPNDNELIGEPRLLRVPITDGDRFLVYRHIYVCKDCNDDERPLRFNHLSTAPAKTRKRKAGHVPRINVETMQTLDTVDYLARTFLPPGKRQKLLQLSKELRDSIV